MTTHVIISSASIGEFALNEQIYAMLDNIVPTEDEMKEIINRISVRVNGCLPGSIAWYPYLSEVWADIDETEELEEDDLLDLISMHTYGVTDEWTNELIVEQRKPYLSVKTIVDKIDRYKEITLYIEHLDGTHDQWDYGEPEDLLTDEEYILRAEVVEISTTVTDNGMVSVYIRCKERHQI